MNDTELLGRIEINPKIMTGKPVIRGTRLTVQHILNRLAHGAAMETIMEEYPGITREDIQACLLFATQALDDTGFFPLVSEKP